MNIAKNNYETTFIINASLEDGQIESTTNHVQEVITRNGGEIKALNKWGRKRLAYPIQKKNNGFYVNMEFIAPAPAMALLERVYQLDENVLRFLTIHLDDKVLAARSQALAASVASAAAAAAAVPVAAAAPAAAVAAPAEASAEKKEPLFKDDASTKSQKPA
jgi:small subunit ribosomal protein S6